MVSQDKKKKKHDDPNSEWRYGGVARRDFRASKDGPEAPKHVRKKSKKEKKQCKRSPDKLHNFVYKIDAPEWWPERYKQPEWIWGVHKCEYCGKIKF